MPVLLRGGVGFLEDPPRVSEAGLGPLSSSPKSTLSPVSSIQFNKHLFNNDQLNK